MHIIIILNINVNVNNIIYNLNKIKSVYQIVKITPLFMVIINVMNV